jgi:hypothetical protein
VSTTPGEFKNVIDALRRALQGPVSTLAAGLIGAGGQFTVSLSPSSYSIPAGQAQTCPVTVTITSQNGWFGTVNLTEQDNFCTGTAQTFSQQTGIAVTPNAPGVATWTLAFLNNCPSGTYKGTVTASASATQYQSADLLVIVGWGQKQCQHNSDCGPGLECVNGVCYSPPLENPLGNCGGANNCSNCTNYTGICKLQNLGTPLCDSASCLCYCTEPDCSQHSDSECAAYGPCSVPINVNGHCRCSIPTVNQCDFVGIQCPSELDICVDTATGAVSGNSVNFGITNNSTINPTVSLRIIPINPIACPGFTGPTLSTSSVSLAPFGLSGYATTIGVSVVSTCATAGCYDYQIVATVSDPQNHNDVIQTLTCPLRICANTGPCFLVEVRCSSLSSDCGSSRPWGTYETNNAPGGCNSMTSCPATIAGCCPAGEYDARLVSKNGFSGNVTITITKGSSCAGDGSMPGVYLLTPANSPLQLNTAGHYGAGGVDLTRIAGVGGTSYQTGPVGSNNTVTGVSGTITASAIFYGRTYYLTCP